MLAAMPHSKRTRRPRTARRTQPTQRRRHPHPRNGRSQPGRRHGARGAGRLCFMGPEKGSRRISLRTIRRTPLRQRRQKQHLHHVRERPILRLRQSSNRRSNELTNPHRLTHATSVALCYTQCNTRSKTQQEKRSKGSRKTGGFGTRSPAPLPPAAPRFRLELRRLRLHPGAASARACGRLCARFCRVAGARQA